MNKHSMLNIIPTLNFKILEHYKSKCLLMIYLYKSKADEKIHPLKL